MKQFPLRKFVGRVAPGLVQYCYPLAYTSPAHFPNALDIAYQLCQPIIASTDPEVFDQTTQDAYLTAAALATEMVPTLFVQKSAIDEMLSLELDSKMHWYDLPWLFDAILFIFPKGFLNAPEEGDCSYLGIARHAKDKQVKMAGIGACPAIANTNSCATGLTSPLLKTLSPIFSFRMVSETHPTIGDIVRESSQPKFYPYQDETMSVAKLPKTDAEFVKFLPELAIRLLVYIAANPTKLRKGKVIGTDRKSGTGQLLEAHLLS